jgi:predicted nuclease with TOPRIM domain
MTSATEPARKLSEEEKENRRAEAYENERLREEYAAEHERLWGERLDILKSQLLWPFRQHFDNYDDMQMVLTKIFKHWVEIQNMSLHDQVVKLLELMKHEWPREIFWYLDYMYIEHILNNYSIIDGQTYTKIWWP